MTAHSRRTKLEFDPGGYELEADMMRVLAHPKRIMIVNLLGPGSGTTTQIADRIGLSLQNTSQHLRVMRDRGIVRATRQGREVRYALTSPVLSECCRLVRQALIAEARSRSARIGSKREMSWRSGESPGADLRRTSARVLVTSGES
jgi:DNA-binding transcriptional ArsR family regulator